jgi:hypothetical protein
MKIFRIAQVKFVKNPIPHIPLHQKGGWEEWKKREDIICDAIRKLAKEWSVGPIGGNLHIDSMGDITMIQKMRNVIDYENPKTIDPDLIEIAKEYHGGYGPGISTRWIRLNHFTWEKMLADMGLLPMHEVSEEEFIKDIRK